MLKIHFFILIFQHTLHELSGVNFMIHTILGPYCKKYVLEKVCDSYYLVSTLYLVGLKQNLLNNEVCWKSLWFLLSLFHSLFCWTQMKFTKSSKSVLERISKWVFLPFLIHISINVGTLAVSSCIVETFDMYMIAQIKCITSRIDSYCVISLFIAQ